MVDVELDDTVIGRGSEGGQAWANVVAFSRGVADLSGLRASLKP